MSKIIIASLVLMTLGFNVAGNLLLKTGANRLGEHAAYSLVNLLNAPLIAGAFCFAMGLLCYIGVLSHIPLNLAQTIFSLQFITVILLASVFLGEPVEPLRWLGILVVFAGLIIVALTA